MSRKSVQNTRITEDYRVLHGALIDVVGVFNRPQGDRILLHEAGVDLDRALFPLLVLIERRGPLAVGELAERVGRDHTTVSRQVAKLERLKLIARQADKSDARVRAAAITTKGRIMTDAIDAARERLAVRAFASWSARDLATLARLTRRFADQLLDWRNA